MNTLESNMKELQSAIAEYNQTHGTTYTAGIGGSRDGYTFFDAESFKRINSESWSFVEVHAYTKDKLMSKLPDLESHLKVKVMLS